MNIFLKYRGSFGWDRIVFRARVVQRQDKLEADVLSLQCVQFSFSFPSSFRLFATNARTSVHLNIRNTCYGTAYSSSWYRAHTPVFDDHPSTRSREHSAKSFPEKVICLFPFPLLFLSFSFFPFFKATHDVFKKRSRKTRRPSTSSKIILKKRQIARFRRNQSPYSVPSRENDPCNFFFPPAKFNLGSNFYFCRIVCNEFCIRG